MAQGSYRRHDAKRLVAAARAAGLRKTDAEKAVSAIVAEIRDALVHGQPIRLLGVGEFRLKVVRGTVNFQREPTVQIRPQWRATDRFRIQAYAALNEGIPR